MRDLSAKPSPLQGIRLTPEEQERIDRALLLEKKQRKFGRRLKYNNDWPLLEKEEAAYFKRKLATLKPSPLAGVSLTAGEQARMEKAIHSASLNFANT